MNILAVMVIAAFRCRFGGLLYGREDIVRGHPGSNIRGKSCQGCTLKESNPGGCSVLITIAGYAKPDGERIRAGYSNLQAMEAISRELPAPISDEFHRVVQEIQLGVQTEKALDNLCRRIPSEDLDLVVTAMNVQREVGGNLAEILDTISHTIRERVRIKGEIRVLTSQVMYSGKFLSLMPVVRDCHPLFLE